MAKKFISILILIACVTISVAQEHPILNYFNANLAGTKVLISLEIKGGEQCNGIQIYRSTDSINFTQIGDIPGICGGQPTAQQYQFTDENPVENAHNYYKVELGQQGFTEVESVLYIVVNQYRYNVYPHPITDVSSLYFSNPNNDTYTYELYTLDGKLIHSQGGITGNQVTIYRMPDSGFFFFRLVPSRSGNVISGKITSG